MSGIGNFILYGAIEYFCCMADLHKKHFYTIAKIDGNGRRAEFPIIEWKQVFFAIEQNKST